MLRRIAILAVLALGPATLAGGCGDDPPTLKDDFIAKVDKLCARDNAETAKAAARFRSRVQDGDYDAAAQVVLDLQATEMATLDQIEAIDPPEDDRFTIEEYLSLGRQLSDLDTEIAEAIRIQDRAASDAAEEEGDSLEDQRDRLADDYGFKVCGSGGSEAGT